MRKFFLMILLAAVSGSAAAEWVRIAGNAIEDDYVDPVTLRHSKDVAKIWVLMDFKVEQVRGSGFRFMSSKALFEFNCKGMQARAVEIRLHSANMASGFSVDATPIPSAWKPVASGSTEHAFWRFACAKM